MIREESNTWLHVGKEEKMWRFCDNAREDSHVVNNGLQAEPEPKEQTVKRLLNKLV